MNRLAVKWWLRVDPKLLLKLISCIASSLSIDAMAT
jgi:hypothetical protein